MIRIKLRFLRCTVYGTMFAHHTCSFHFIQPFNSQGVIWSQCFWKHTGELRVNKDVREKLRDVNLRPLGHRCCARFTQYLCLSVYLPADFALRNRRNSASQSQSVKSAHVYMGELRLLIKYACTDIHSSHF